MKKILLMLTSVMTFAAHSAIWEINDVSVLFPLPTEKDGKSFLLQASDIGRQGRLFPLEHKTTISDLVISYDRPEPDDIYESIRVLGMRIDPCFKFTDLSVEKCHPQIRLVWQPTAGLGTNQVTSFDASVHSFYSLTDKEFASLKQDLQNIKYKNVESGIYTQGKNLGVHPAFLNVKRRAIFNTELKKTILKYAGENKLIRFTFMRLLTTDLWWEFGGRDLNSQGEWIVTAIPKLHKGQEKQEFFNEESFKPNAMRGTILPDVLTDTDNLKDLIPSYGVGNNERGKKIVKLGITTMNRIENPNIHHPATLDCVHCHIAEPVKIWLENEEPQILKELIHAESAYVQEFFGRHNLKNATRLGHNKSLRAFGYYKNRPSLNQRVINESASVADFLNRSYK